MKRIILPILGVVGLSLIMLVVIRQINAAGNMIEQPLGPSKVTEQQSGTLSGEEVVSLIERLGMVQSDEKIYVFTNGNTVCAEYTKFGATASSNILYHPALNNVFAKVTPIIGGSLTPSEPLFITGNYRDKTDATYINPQLTYDMQQFDSVIIITQRVDS